MGSEVVGQRGEQAWHGECGPKGGTVSGVPLLSRGGLGFCPGLLLGPPSRGRRRKRPKDEVTKGSRNRKEKAVQNRSGHFPIDTVVSPLT